MANEYEAPDIDFRVSLRNPQTKRRVVFEATPDLIEARNVNYKTIEPVHAPGQIYAYASTASRSFNISSIRLISRTSVEAEENLERLWLLRSWTMPRFGKGTLSDEQSLNRQLAQQEGHSREDLEFFGIGDKSLGTERRGEPPPVLLLSAYSRDSAYSQSPGHINRVPVVIQNLNITYPSDTDYIPTQNHKIPMPTIMMLDISMMETHAPVEYENFCLSKFKSGILGGF